ncbi:MAG TPA: ATP-binding cassette domain-containing protein [Desulfitobacteriaceae bacterium]|nr:ATP-binding cassette domain-containing protein [Desulfitobacteriaceae bacterium]
MNHYILTAEHIQKKYNGNTVLRDVSIHIKKGEIYGLIGKNGSGKTTLFRILTGLIPRYNGIVSVGEAGVQKCKVSAVINSPSLFLNLSAFENMKAQAFLLGMRDDSRIEQALKTVGLEDCNNKLARDFSQGMTQRLKLGMALLENPDILILDEPVNGLDPDGIAELRELLLHLNHASEMTILISSHILSELEQVATCFAILHDGEIAKEVFIQDILQSGTTLEKLYMQSTKGGKQG